MLILLPSVFLLDTTVLINFRKAALKFMQLTFLCEGT